jgi:hypothetical protein
MSFVSREETCRTAQELGRRFAVAGALVAALVTLFQHAPVWLACLRGGGTLLVLASATRLGTAALSRALVCDQVHASQERRS